MRIEFHKLVTSDISRVMEYYEVGVAILRQRFTAMPISANLATMKSMLAKGADGESGC